MHETFFFTKSHHFMKIDNLRCAVLFRFIKNHQKGVVIIAFFLGIIFRGTIFFEIQVILLKNLNFTKNYSLSRQFFKNSWRKKLVIDCLL